MHEVGPRRLRQDAFIFQLALIQLIKSLVWLGSGGSAHWICLMLGIVHRWVAQKTQQIFRFYYFWIVHTLLIFSIEFVDLLAEHCTAYGDGIFYLWAHRVLKREKWTEIFWVIANLAFIRFWLDLRFLFLKCKDIFGQTRLKIDVIVLDCDFCIQLASYSHTKLIQ